MQRRRFIHGMTALGGIAALGPLAGIACSEAKNVQASELKSSVARATPHADSAGATQALTAATAAFGWEILRELSRSQTGNLFLSPWSISLAMSMVRAGARGDSRTGLTRALGLDALGEGADAAFNAAAIGLAEPPPRKDSGQAFELSVANSSWVQAGYSMQQDYLDILARYYGAGLWQADFAKDPERGREAVNEWVEQRTNGRIQDLLPGGSVTTLTRLILANAIYFKADWTSTFDKDATASRPFRLAAGATRDVATMHKTASYAYAKGDSVEALEIPYAGGSTSMVVLLPAAGALPAVEARAQEVSDQLIPKLQLNRVSLAMPKWEVTSELSLAGALAALGADAVFDPRRADLSGMNGKRDLSVTGVFHKAFVKVDEKGTEAAAATGAVVGATSAPIQPPIEFTMDRPFLYLIRDRRMGVVLFAGRVADPAATA